MFVDKPSIMLYVSDLPESVEFYSEVLDFGFKGYWNEADGSVTTDYAEAGEPSYAEVQVAGGSIGLHFDEAFDMQRPAFELRIEVEDARATYDTLRGRGADPSEPTEMPWGETMFTLRDPDGHVWNFFETA